MSIFLIHWSHPQFVRFIKFYDNEKHTYLKNFSIETFSEYNFEVLQYWKFLIGPTKIWILMWTMKCRRKTFHEYNMTVFLRLGTQNDFFIDFLIFYFFIKHFKSPSLISLMNIWFRKKKIVNFKRLGIGTLKGHWC